MYDQKSGSSIKDFDFSTYYIQLFGPLKSEFEARHVVGITSMDKKSE